MYVSRDIYIRATWLRKVERSSPHRGYKIISRGRQMVVEKKKYIYIQHQMTHFRLGIVLH